MSMEIRVSDKVTVESNANGVIWIDEGGEAVEISPDELPALIAALERIRDQQAGGAK